MECQALTVPNPSYRHPPCNTTAFLVDRITAKQQSRIFNIHNRTDRNHTPYTARFLETVHHAAEMAIRNILGWRGEQVLAELCIKDIDSLLRRPKKMVPQLFGRYRTVFEPDVFLGLAITLQRIVASNRTEGYTARKAETWQDLKLNSTTAGYKPSLFGPLALGEPWPGIPALGHIRYIGPDPLLSGAIWVDLDTNTGSLVLTGLTPHKLISSYRWPPDLTQKVVDQIINNGLSTDTYATTHQRTLREMELLIMADRSGQISLPWRPEEMMERIVVCVSGIDQELRDLHVKTQSVVAQQLSLHRNNYEAIAKRTHVPRRTISSIVNDGHLPSRENLMRLVKDRELTLLAQLPWLSEDPLRDHELSLIHSRMQGRRLFGIALGMALDAYSIDEKQFAERCYPQQDESVVRAITLGRSAPLALDLLQPYADALGAIASQRQTWLRVARASAMERRKIRWTRFIDKQLGRSLRERRIALGLSTRDLGQKAGITHSQITGLETGESGARNESTWQKLADALRQAGDKSPQSLWDALLERLSLELREEKRLGTRLRADYSYSSNESVRQRLNPPRREKLTLDFPLSDRIEYVFSCPENPHPARRSVSFVDRVAATTSGIAIGAGIGVPAATFADGKAPKRSFATVSSRSG